MGQILRSCKKCNASPVPWEFSLFRIIKFFYCITLVWIISQTFLPCSPMVKQKRFLKWKCEKERIWACFSSVPFHSAQRGQKCTHAFQIIKNSWQQDAQKLGVQQRIGYARFENFHSIFRSILNFQGTILRWTGPSQPPLQPMRRRCWRGTKNLSRCWERARITEASDTDQSRWESGMFIQETQTRTHTSAIWSRQS